MNKIWQDLRGDLRRVGLYIVLAIAAAAALSFVPWGGLPGDLLSGIAFVLILLVVLVHILRRISLPLQLLAYARKAIDEPLSAAVVFAAVVAFMLGLLWAGVTLFVQPARADELPAGLPANAYRNLPIVIEAQQQFWPSHPAPSVLGSQVEQETCVSLRSKRCWSEYAELRTDRERGVGLGQVTKTNRFDNLTEARQRYGKLLAGWSWDAPYNPVYQARALVLHDKRCFTGVSDTASTEDQLAMAANCYNAGPGQLAKSRASCLATAGCDPARWFGNVELAGGPSQKVAAGYSKSFYVISREYVRAVMVDRRARYRWMDRQA